MELRERLQGNPRGGGSDGDRTDAFAELKDRVHLAVISDLGPRLYNAGIDEASLQQVVLADIRNRLTQERGIAAADRDRLVQEIADDINKIVAQVGRRVDESSPMVDARLPDGSRVNAVLPPLSLGGALLTIRKFSKQRWDLGGLVAMGSIPAEAKEFLDQCVRAELNILISGGTGSGKTTLLNAMSGAIPDSERIVTIEDAAELRLNQAHVLRLEARPKNIEGQGEIPIRELVRNSLRMRPDRIIVGEVRGAESLDMLQAMNTGHDGSLSTVHANSPRDAISRIESMIRAVRQQISRALDLLVHIERFSDGSRKLSAITEVQRMEGDTVTLQDIFEFKMDKALGGDHGALKYTGLRPTCFKFERHGVALPRYMDQHNFGGDRAAPTAGRPARVEGRRLGR